MAAITLLPKPLCTIKHASKAELKKLFLQHQAHIFFFKVHFTTKQMVLLWVLPLVLSWLIFAWVITKLCGWIHFVNMKWFCIDNMLMILCLFNCQSDADKFFEFLNRQHPNIKFTFEKQVNKQISFLDVLITIVVDQLCTSVFRKELAVGSFTNYLGFTPFSYKIGLVRTLLHRAFMISSSWFLFHEEIVKIKHYLEKLLSPGFCW